MKHEIDTFCRCDGCRAAVIRRVDAVTASMLARHAAQWAREEAESWESGLRGLKATASHSEAPRPLSDEATRIARLGR